MQNSLGVVAESSEFYDYDSVSLVDVRYANIITPTYYILNLKRTYTQTMTTANCHSMYNKEILELHLRQSGS